MTKVAVIDDDYASAVLVENLQFRGFDASRIANASDAMKSMDDLARYDVIVLDMIMERAPNDEQHKLSGDNTTGMSILKALREKNAALPILVFTASRDPEIASIVRALNNAAFLPKWDTPKLEEIVARIDQLTGKQVVKRQSPQCFIVHGRDEAAKLQLKNYLQNVLKLPEPKILHELPNRGRTIIEKFEDASVDADIVFVLLTPDDLVANPVESNDEKRRARQNVIFELGYFLGVFGRVSGRVLLLFKEPLDLPSDLSGVVYIDISAGIEAAGEQIRRELQHV